MAAQWEERGGPAVAAMAVRHNTRTSACEKGQWQPARALLCEMLGVTLEPTIIGYSTQLSACEKEQWQPALALRCHRL